jgi:hypothetical protein
MMVGVNGVGLGLVAASIGEAHDKYQMFPVFSVFLPELGTILFLVIAILNVIGLLSLSIPVNTGLRGGVSLIYCIINIGSWAFFYKDVLRNLPPVNIRTVWDHPDTGYVLMALWGELHGFSFLFGLISVIAIWSILRKSH